MESIPQFLAHFSTVFTRPAFKIFERLVKGFLEVHRPTAVTQLNAQKPPEEHFCTVYDFLQRYAWQSLELAQTLLDWLMNQLQPDQRVILAIDDTKNFKPHARCMEGVCWHAEHHRVVQTKVKTKEGEELKATGVVGQKGQQCCPHLYGSFVAYNWSFAGWFWVCCIAWRRVNGVVFRCEQGCFCARNIALQVRLRTSSKLPKSFSKP